MRTRKLSAKQKANLLTGQLLRQCHCTSGLISLLRKSGYAQAAKEVEEALSMGRAIAAQLGKQAREAAYKET